MIIALRTLLLKTAWAPVAVLFIHAAVARTALRKPLDFWMHYLGGVSITYFLYHSLICFEPLLGKSTSFGRYLFTFALACTVGLFWEFGELFSDVYLHTHIQQTITETMSDLIADATGAVTTLLLIFVGGFVHRSKAT